MGSIGASLGFGVDCMHVGGHYGVHHSCLGLTVCVHPGMCMCRISGVVVARSKKR